MVFRIYSEITPKLGKPWNSEITPKLLRNWGTVEFRNYSEIIPKLGTVELWNYSEITPKLGTGIVTVQLRKLLRNYSETMDRDYGIPKLFRNHSEIMGLGPWPWNSENCGLLYSSISSGLLVCLPRHPQAD